MASQHDPIAPRSKVGVVLSEERVDLAYRALCESANKGEIKKLLKAQFGLGFRASEDVISAALERRAQDFDQGSYEENRTQALQFYAHIRDRNKHASIRDQIRAQERIDKILGIEAAQQHEHRGTMIGFSLAEVMRAARQELATIDVPQLESDE